MPRTPRITNRSAVPWVVAPILALLLLACLAAPAYAQSDTEEEDDANRTAQTPEECVRPDPPDTDDLSDVSRNIEANQAYEDCLERTENNAPDGEGERPNASETTDPDPISMNENATTPEECVAPDAPGEGDDPEAYAEAQQAYDDCLVRTGPDGGDNEGSGEGSGDGENPECTKPPDDAPADQMQEYEECLAATGELDNDDEVPGDSGDDTTGGGLASMTLSFFWGIMESVWKHTAGWALERIAQAYEANLLSLPDLHNNQDLLGAYSGAVEKLRPAILVGILVLGILMMVRSDNYDLAYAGFQGLPKLVGIALALAFLPQFMGELSNITSGMTEAFFPAGQDINAAGLELFEAAIGNLAITNFLNVIFLLMALWVGGLVLIVSLMNKILYALLFLAGPFVLVASIVPSMNSLAGSWFRGVIACAAIPALWSIQMGIGTFIVTSPESIFGEASNMLGFISNSAVTSLGAIIILWLMYKTPFKVIEWAFNVQLPGRGGLGSLAKTAATLAVAIPLKTAVATTVKGALTGGGGGTSVGRSIQETNERHMGRITSNYRNVLQNPSAENQYKWKQTVNDPAVNNFIKENKRDVGQALSDETTRAMESHMKKRDARMRQSERERGNRSSGKRKKGRK